MKTKQRDIQTQKESEISLFIHPFMGDYSGCDLGKRERKNKNKKDVRPTKEGVYYIRDGGR